MTRQGSSEHAVLVGAVLGHGLRDIPELDYPLAFEAKDVNEREGLYRIRMLARGPERLDK